MKVGDLVSYIHCWDVAIAVLLYINEEGGTIKVLLSSGEIGWLVTSGCEVIG